MSRHELVTILVLTAAAILFAWPKLLARTDTAAAFSGACDSLSPPTDCGLPGYEIIGAGSQFLR